MLLARFLEDRRASIAPIFALAIVPIVGAVGAAVDYSVANKVRAQLQAAADAAAVAGIAKSSIAMTTAATMTRDGSITAGRTDALRIFNAELAGKTGFKLDKVTAKVAKASGAVTSKVDFTAAVNASFMGLIGIKTLTVMGTSSAANGVAAYIDFYMLLDNSPSMGVAATPADIATMVDNTSDKCAFACHDQSDPDNYYKLAKKLGVTMRIDVLRTATQKLVDTASATETVPDQFRMAIYNFNRDLEAIAPLTANLALVKSQANTIDLVKLPYASWNDYQLTDYSKVLPAIGKLIATPGNGMSALTPQKILFFVSDGVADYDKTGTRAIAPIDTASCTAIKKRGIKIALLYTTYLPLPTNDFYNKNVAPFASRISPTMKSCASPDLYFEVSPTQGIAEAMQALFRKALAQARLTK